MRVTPGARRQLLDAVASLKRRDPERAALLVLEIGDRLADLTAGLEIAPELESVRHSATAAVGHRLYLRERTDGMWLIAIWPERELRR
ncbi:MAG: hypothetical protein PVG53_03015 [Holophagae bacterium]|jgi:plasmid stabilization system protein ParE